MTSVAQPSPGTAFNIGRPGDKNRGFFTSGAQNAATAGEMQNYLQQIAGTLPTPAQYGREIAANDNRVNLLNRTLSNPERSDMYTLGNIFERVVEQNIQILMGFSQSFWLELAPVLAIEGDKYVWDGIVVKATLPDETPIHTRSRLVGVEAYAGGTTLTRVSKGLRISVDMLKQGAHRGEELLKQMAVAVSLCLLSGRALRIVTAIIDVLFTSTAYFNGRELWQAMGLTEVIRNARCLFWGTRTLKNPLAVVTSYMTGLMKMQNVETSTLALLMHKHTNDALNFNPQHLTYSKSGLVRNGWEENAARGFRVDGIAPTVYPVEPMTEGCMGIMDPMMMIHTAGLMAPFVDYDHNIRQDEYVPQMRTRNLFNVQSGCWFPVTLEKVRLMSDRWDKETGELNSFKNRELWSHLPPTEQLAYKSGDDIWMCPDTGDAAAMLGSAPQFDAQHFLDSTKPLLAKIGKANVDRYEKALHGLMNAVAIIEAQAPDANVAADIIGAVVPLGEEPMVRAMIEPFSPCLNFVAQEIKRNDSGFINYPLDKLGSAFELPPYIGSYFGLKWLTTTVNPTNMLKSKSMIGSIRMWLDDFEQLAQDLSLPFGQSVAMNPAYVTGEWARASFASQLFDYLIPNRTPIWVQRAGAGSTVLATLEAARASFLLNSKLYSSIERYNTVKDAAGNLTDDQKALIVAGQTLILGVYKKLGPDKKTEELAEVKAEYERTVAFPHVAGSAIPLTDLITKVLKNKDTIDYALDLAQKLDAALKAPSAVNPHFSRTPLWVSPSQMAVLSAVATATISSVDNRDQPMPQADFKTFASNQQVVAESVFGVPLSSQPQMMSGKMFKRAKHMHEAVWRFGTETGRGMDITMIRTALGYIRDPTSLAAARMANAPASVATSTLEWMSDGKTSSTTSQLPLGSSTTQAMRRTEFKKYFGCADPAIVNGVNSVFINTFNRMTYAGTSPVHQLAARVMMSMPTNLNAINRMEGYGVSLGDSYVILRALNYQAYVLVLMKPGRETIELLTDKAGPMVMVMLQPLTQFYSVSAAESVGVAVKVPKNICVHTNFDPAVYMGGMTDAWRNLDEHGRKPNSKTIGDMIAVAIPASSGHCMPSWWSPTGVVSAMASGDVGGASGFVPEQKVKLGVEAFERMRLGWENQGHLSPMIPRLRQYGNHIAPTTFTGLYHLDCVQVPVFAGKSVEWKKTKGDFLIKRDLYKSDLRDMIGGPIQAVQNFAIN